MHTNTNLEVFAEGLGTGSTLQLAARTLAADGQRTLWRCIAASGLPVVAQQFFLAAELQVTHVTGEQLHPDMSQRVGDSSGTV